MGGQRRGMGKECGHRGGVNEEGVERDGRWISGSWCLVSLVSFFFTSINCLALVMAAS